MSKNYRDLKIWEMAMDNCASIYKATEKFPKHELYGLVSQMRRAAVSIPANIAEGYSRRGPKELKQYLSIALGSSSELETYIILAQRLGYLSNEESNALLSAVEHVGKMITNFYKTIV